MKQAVSLLVFMYTVTYEAFAQKQTQQVRQVWFAYFNQSRFSEKWGMWVDLHIRTKQDFFSDFSTGIARAGLTYFANDHLRFTAGYAYVNHFPSDNHTGVSQPEHRPWQQVMWFNTSKKSRIIQQFRLEQRYRRKILNNEELGEGYQFNYRWRYNFLLMLPLSKNAFAANTLSFAFNNEVHINMGKEIVNNYFDQNRFFAGFAYHLNKNILQFGYMNIFQQLPAGNRYRSLHVPRIIYFHNLDLRN